MAEDEPFPRDENDQLVNPESVKREGERLAATAKATNTEREILKALNDSKPSFLTDGNGIRGPNADLDSRERKYGETFFRRTDFDRGRVDRQPRQPAFPVEDVTQATGVTTTLNHPFRVTTAGGPGGTTVLKVYPGKIAGIVPTLGGVKLDNNSSPSQSLVGVVAPISLFLRANITVDADNLFRSSITAVKVSTDNDSDVTPDIDGGTGEVPELRVFWNDPSNTIGHFYLRIADINVNGDSRVTAILQWLFSSYASFVSAGNEVVILA